MSAIPLNPFDFFTDLNGKALDQGYIYIGQPNLDPRTNQIQVYYDKDLTIPAVQPLRTHHGLLISGCGPTTIYANVTDFSVVVLDKKEKQVMNIPSMLTAMHGSWGWKNDRYYLTRAAFVADAATGNLNSLGDGTIVFAGGLLYVRKASATMIADLPKWIPGGVAEVRHFGAVVNTNSTAALQNAIDAKIPVKVIGRYYANALLSTTGSLLIYGESKQTSVITWLAASTTTGLKTTLTNWYFDVNVNNLALLTQKAGDGTGLQVDFTPALQSFMAGTGVIDFFKVYCRIENCKIAGEVDPASQGWKEGIRTDCAFAIRIRYNELQGKASGTALLPANFITDSIGIHIPDQSIRTLASNYVEDNRIFGFLDAAKIYNVEGFWFLNNDLQVCYNGLMIQNTIIKVNQYRIFGNHIGTTGTQIKVSNARQVLIEHNEISYRSGRTDGGTVSLIVLDGVYSGNVIGNSIRGNVFDDTNVIVDGIEFQWVNHLPSTTDYTRYIVVEGNSFQNMRNAMNNTAGDNLRYLNHCNNAFEVRGKYLESTTQGANLTQTMLRGNGKFDQISVSAANPALYIEQYGSSAMALNRVGGGVLAAIYNGTTLVGSITTTESNTAYNTSSDQTLKNDKGLLDPETAKEIIRLIKIHNYDWKVDGATDIGVFAQELYEVYPSAVAKGGWFRFDEETSSTLECHQFDDGAYYVPWGVDYSKLVPVMLCVLASQIA